MILIAVGCLVVFILLLILANVFGGGKSGDSEETAPVDVTPEAVSEENAQEVPASESDVVAAEVSSAAARFCPECGTPLAPGASFCPNCGTKVN